MSLLGASLLDAGTWSGKLFLDIPFGGFGAQSCRRTRSDGSVRAAVPRSSPRARSLPPSTR